MFGRSRLCAASALVLAAGALVLPATGASAATPAKPYDFNGDGYTDIALGSPYGKAGSVTHAGFVSVVYGSASGPNTGRFQVISQESTGIPGEAEAEDLFGNALASADFDEDGYADLVVGIPGEDTGAGTDAGFITIIFGGASGLTGRTNSYIEPGTSAGPSHRFGATLTQGNGFHAGSYVGYVAAAPGTPDFYVSTFSNVPPAAPTTRRVSVRDGNGALAAQGVDAFYLAAGDVTGDGIADIAAGWRDSDAFTPVEQGGFAVFSGNADGTFTEGTPIAAPGVAAIAVGDFDREGHADVAVGQPGDTPTLGGQVAIYRGSVSGVSTGNVYVLSQGSGIPGTAKAGDQFGGSLAVGDANGNGNVDLAIGVPLKDAGTLTDAGEAAIAYGSPNGLSNGQAYTQDTGAIPGTAEAGDKMGFNVAILDHDNNGRAELDVGIPNENGTEGYLVTLPGTLNGVTTTGSTAFGSTTLGVASRTALVGLRIGHR